MRALGLVGRDWILASSKEVKLRKWNALSEEDRKYQDLLMATYAGMVDRIDQNIGKLVRKLKELGQYDNTLILFFSDNGACEATMLRERLPERISRPCTDNPAQFRRFMMNQGNQRVPSLNLESRVRRGKK